MTQIGAYVHVPFCERKCLYCDFNTYAGLDHLAEAYVNALRAEMRAAGLLLAGERIDTVFVGGGTPTLLRVDLLEKLMSGMRSALHVAEGAEITCEANPGTVDRSRFVVLRDLGVTRLSIGVQSFDDGELSFLGRIHTARQAEEAFGAARDAGFDNISLDLMFAVPGQSIDVWRSNLQRAVTLRPEHISLYNLTVEPGTPLARFVAAGRVRPMSDDDAAALYEAAMAVLADSGYVHYEVSNWARRPSNEHEGPHAGAGGSPLLADEVESSVVGARPSRACRHNMLYWRNGSYVGFGPGAHSHAREGTPLFGFLESTSDAVASTGAVARRWANVLSVPDYVGRMRRGDSVVASGEGLPSRVSMGETMMMGLRLLVEGVTHRRFHQLHGVDVRDVYPSQLAELGGQGLIEIDDERTRLTRSGLMVGNRVFEQFVEVD